MARRGKAIVKDIKGKLDFTNTAKDIMPTTVDEFIPDTYLLYAASVILDRAIIGEDGLLPVQKRILWAMYANKHFPTSSPAKVLSIIGEVAKYHPHGDSSIASSIVRMAQPYSLRTTLVLGNGNFASIPGDDASAPRYISASMTKAAMDCVEELKYNAVEMGKNYSGELDEPTELPVRFPISVINGSQGIAVGFAANMPQHNPTEAMKVARLLLKDPHASIKRIMSIMPGPDFKTGGVVMGTSGIREYYETGRGSLTIRAKYRLEQGEGGKSTIVFYEIPPYISVQQCLSAINDVLDSEEFKDSKDKKKQAKYKSMASARKAMNGISRAIDLTDFDTGNGVDFQVELKPSANPRTVLMALFQHTPLQSKFAVNNTVIYDGKPQNVGIKALFKQFLDFRRRCVRNVNISKKEMAEHRMKLINGILSILLDVDKAIAIIRSSRDEDMARKKLMSTFKIDGEQADYILNMALRRLTKQNSTELKSERKQLMDSIHDYDGIINDPVKLDAEVDRLLVETSKIIADKRYMEILDATDEEIAAMDKDMKSSARMDDKDVSCVLSVDSKGNIMRTMGTSAETRHPVSILSTTNQHRIIALGDDGHGYMILPSYIMDGKDSRMRTNAAFEMPSGTRFVTMVNDGDMVMTVMSDGFVKLTGMTFNEKWREHIVHTPKSSDVRLAGAFPVSQKYMDTADAIIITNTGRVIRFPVSDVSPTGFGARGVAGMRLKKGERVISAMISTDEKKDSIMTMTGMTVKSTPVRQIPRQHRAGTGVILQRTIGNDPVIMGALNAVTMTGRSVIPVKPTKRDTPPQPVKPGSYLAIS